jgi:hypothetical protein
VAESLKQLWLALLTRGLREQLHSFLPVVVAPRTLRIRVTESLAVHEVRACGGEGAATQAALLEELHARMQGALEALGREIEPEVRPYARPNLFATAPEFPSKPVRHGSAAGVSSSSPDHPA